MTQTPHNSLPDVLGSRFQCVQLINSRNFFHLNENFQLLLIRVRLQAGRVVSQEGETWAAGSSPGVAVLVYAGEGVILPRGEEGLRGGGRLRGRCDPQEALPAVGAASGEKGESSWKFWGDGAADVTRCIEP